METENMQQSVLLVDDSILELTVFTIHLEEAGFRVEEATDGVAALAALAAKPHAFCAVISDVEMPNLNGPGFVAEARKRGFVLPIIVHSCVSCYENAAINAGATAFMTKRDSPEGLVALLKECVAGSSV